jgi:hypothetical protein
MLFLAQVMSFKVDIILITPEQAKAQEVVFDWLLNCQRSLNAMRKRPEQHNRGY